MDSKIVREIIEWIKSLAIAGLLAIIIHTFLFAVVIVSGPSMETTLHNNERLIMNKMVYNFNDPKHGDIIVFHATENDDYIKRVIGLPGDTVEYRNNQLFLNGEPVDEPYLNDSTYTNDYEPLILPEGSYFVMGDNRLNSTDSRIIGPISEDQIVGRVSLLIWPLNRIGFVD